MTYVWHILGKIRHLKVMNRQIIKFDKLSQQETIEYQSGHSKPYIQNGHSNQEQQEIINNTQKKWVVNLSSTPLTQAQSPNFALTPQRPPYGEYSDTIESPCQNLDNTTAEELRADVYRVLRHPHHLKPNLSKDEMIAIKQLKTNEDRMILNADKGVALMAMNRKDYTRKARELLEDTKTYRPIHSDPTNKLKTMLLNILKKIKVDTGMEENIYRRMYPTGASSPKFHGLPEIHKKDIHQRPTVSSIGSVSYGVAKELARILKLLVGSSCHHVNNTKEFTDEIRNTKLEERE